MFDTNGNEIAGLCNGSTADSDSVCEGSNPSPAAKTPNASAFGVFLFPIKIPSGCLKGEGIRRGNIKERYQLSQPATTSILSS